MPLRLEGRCQCLRVWWRPAVQVPRTKWPRRGGLRGQGAPGRAGPGDAIVEIAIRPHPLYRREGETLVMDLPISVPDAVLGAKVQAPTPEGPVTLTVPKGSNTGQSLRLKGRGLPDPKTGVRGDLLARLQIFLPETPDPELEAFAEDWRKTRPYAPRRKG